MNCFFWVRPASPHYQLAPARRSPSSISAGQMLRYFVCLGPACRGFAALRLRCSCSSRAWLRCFRPIRILHCEEDSLCPVSVEELTFFRGQLGPAQAFCHGQGRGRELLRRFSPSPSVPDMQVARRAGPIVAEVIPPASDLGPVFFGSCGDGYYSVLTNHESMFGPRRELSGARSPCVRTAPWTVAATRSFFASQFGAFSMLRSVISAGAPSPTTARFIFGGVPPPFWQAGALALSRCISNAAVYAACLAQGVAVYPELVAPGAPVKQLPVSVNRYLAIPAHDK